RDLILQLSKSSIYSTKPLKVDITPDIGRGSARRRGGYPDISQPSFHNSSIFTAPSLTKLVSFSETLQDETVN
ncbi:hypothetical protein RB534_23285, partial [Klebsiella pneumoniae]|nr:hypothetical protein [Klebsiella pneumoniae]MEC6501347.1 hypothetical protein [Klebsiella pneumoniae]